MTGKIIRGVGGFYYVYAENSRVYECRARGIFRKNGIKPLVGDNVQITVLNEETQEGNLDRIFERTNALIRPAVANVDQALVIFAVDEPRPSLNLLDRFLVMMELQGVRTVICFNKKDKGTETDRQRLASVYAASESRVLFTDALNGAGLDELKGILNGKTTTVAGPSGVGKSSLINRICPEAEMETGEISRKLARGKHTTRHAELFHVGQATFLMDTPGFTSLYLPEMEKEDLKEYYPEFAAYRADCRFQGCVHDREPDCGVKAAVEAGKISAVRYENYRDLYHELQDRRRY